MADWLNRILGRRPVARVADECSAPECQGADFSQVAWALGQGLIDHADRDGLKGVRRAVFMDRGGHAVGEICPTAKPADPHIYWCQYPDDECSCPPGAAS